MCTIGRDSEGFYLSGNTFPYRDVLKELGGKWIAIKKQWRFNNIKFKELQQKLKDKDVLLSKKTIYCTFHRNHDQGDLCPFAKNEKRKYFISKEKGCNCNDKDDRACCLCYSACCDKAERSNCVCIICFKCEEHGSHCYGSHE